MFRSTIFTFTQNIGNFRAILLHIQNAKNKVHGDNRRWCHIGALNNTKLHME